MTGDLSATEERILGYLAGGLHDAEIAVRVGLPVGDVKARVTSLMQRGHFTDRAELLDWYRRPLEPGMVERVTIGPPLRARRWFAPIVGIAAFVAGAALMAFLTWPASGEPGAAAGASPAPTESPATESQVPIATPTLNATLVQSPQIGNATTIDEGFAPIVINWAGPRASLSQAITIGRLYVDPATGELERETVWEQHEDTSFVAAITNDLGTLLAVQYSDADGTWLEVITLGGRVLRQGPIDGDLRPAFFVDGLGVVLTSFSSSTSQWYSDRGAAQNVVPPANATGPPIGWDPQTGLLWLAADGAVTSGITIDGQGALLRLAIQALKADWVRTFGLMRDDGLDGESRIQGGGFGSGLAIPAVSVDDGLALVAWAADDRPFSSLIALGERVVLTSWEGAFDVRGTASGARFVGYHCFELRHCPGGRPAVYEVRDRRVRELAGIGEDERLIGAQRGPFVRVVSGSTTRDTPPVECAPIHLVGPTEDPGWCANVGEPLTLADLIPTDEFDQGTAQVRDFDGVAYVRVLTPLGDAGWIRVDAVDGLDLGPDDGE